MPDTPALASAKKWPSDYCVPSFGFPITPWSQAFAWWPVKTFDGRWTIGRVLRRRYHAHSYLSGGPDQWTVYATVTP